MEKLLLRPDEVAETLGIGRTRAYALICSGVIPSMRIGKNVRVPLDQLQRWVKRQVSDSSAKDRLMETGSLSNQSV